MQVTNTEARWGGVSQLLHWAMAVLIVAMMVLGWVMVYWPLGPTKLALFAWHKSFGITILALAVIRLLWRLSNPAPALPATMAPWERAAAQTSHVLLYVLMFAMPLSGYVINSAANFPLTVFGLLAIPNLTPESEALQEVAETVHLTLFWLFVTVLLAHIGGALRHYFLLGDDVLQRMLPGGSRTLR